LAAAAVWHFFAYMNADDGLLDEHRYVPEWRLDDVVRWARYRGYDNILLTRTEKTTDFRVSDLNLSDPGGSRGIAA